MYFSEENFNFFPLTLDASKFVKPAESAEVEEGETVNPGGVVDRFEDISPLVSTFRKRFLDNYRGYNQLLSDMI